MMEPEITQDQSPPEVSSADQPSENPPDQSPPAQPPPSATQATAEPEAPTAAERKRQAHSVLVSDLHAYYGPQESIKGISINFPANEVTALIGPSGSGKSTLVRCINRMHEEIPGARAEGSVKLDDLDVYDPKVDVTAVRRAIGMVFQKPNPFPTMSIFDNVAAGLRLTGTKRDNLRERRAPVTALGRSLGRGQEPPDGARDRALGRPAAAPVHRPHDRGRARGDPDGRAVPRRSTRSRR